MQAYIYLSISQKFRFQVRFLLLEKYKKTSQISWNIPVLWSSVCRSEKRLSKLLLHSENYTLGMLWESTCGLSPWWDNEAFPKQALTPLRQMKLRIWRQKDPSKRNVGRGLWENFWQFKELKEAGHTSNMQVASILQLVLYFCRFWIHNQLQIKNTV